MIYTYTNAEMEAHMLLTRNAIYSSSSNLSDIHKSADTIILLAEKIKAERATAAFQQKAEFII